MNSKTTNTGKEVVMFNIDFSPKLEKYTCQRCGKTWKPTKNSVNISCAVLHSPGSCCHYMEKEVKPHPKERKK